MSSKLKTEFPMIWEREELLEKIYENRELKLQFSRWKKGEQEEFLDFCTGMRGVKILYDSFFKEIMSPEYTPERLNDFLSEVLKKKVKIKTLLPNDSTRIADENSLLITDLVVELEDGSLANIEVQKIGYMFPGERSACYSSDLVLRQYKRIRSEKKKKFSYKDIRDVYVIVFFEESTKEFQKFPDTYIHNSMQVSDSGLKLNLLQKFIFIPLDIFKKRPQNKVIKNKMEAWLTFLSAEEPEEILRLLKSYPEFRPMYQQVYDMCRNVGEIMGIFSEELLMMDRNTVQLMIDEMQEELNKKGEELTQINEEVARKSREIVQKNEEITQKNEEIAQKDEEIARKNEDLENARNQIKELQERLKLLG